MATISETQLDIYNQSLFICEERALASTIENRKPRYLLDQIWNNGGVDACLEESDWLFARRTEQIVYDPSIQPSFGYIHAFKKPADWLRTSAVASDPYFQSPLVQYSDEGGYWWGDLDQIFVKYVSNDPAYGGNFSMWPESFKQFVAAHFASKIIGSLTHSKSKIDDVKEERRKLVTAARGKDAMGDPPGFFGRGQLSRARQGLYFGRPGRVDAGWY
jgi:hypothetical protein